MNAIPDKSDYVRYTLYSAGITPTDEEVAQIYATGCPHLAVDSLVAAYQVHRQEITKFMESVYRVTPKQTDELKEQLHQAGLL